MGNQLYWVFGRMRLLLVAGQAKGKCKNNTAVLPSELIYCTSKSITNNRATEAKESSEAKQGFTATRKQQFKAARKKKANCKLQHHKILMSGAKH